MHDSKGMEWAGHFHDEGEAADKDVSHDEVAAASNDDNGANGWQQYRRWISKAPAPRKRRSSIDPSLYSWKGYRNWTEEVKRNWTDPQDK